MASARIGRETYGCALGAVFLECRNRTIPGKPSLFSHAKVDHGRDLIDGRWNFGLRELRLWTKRCRGTGAMKSGKHALRMDRGDYIGPYTASRMPPETPRRGSNFLVP